MADVGQRGREHGGVAYARRDERPGGGDVVRRRHGAWRDQEGHARVTQWFGPVTRVRCGAQGRETGKLDRRGEGAFLCVLV